MDTKILLLTLSLFHSTVFSSLKRYDRKEKWEKPKMIERYHEYRVENGTKQRQIKIYGLGRRFYWTGGDRCPTAGASTTTFTTNKQLLT